MKMIGPWALALLALAIPGWAGDIYRWTDAAGNVHYSNMEAAGADATAVAPAGPAAAPRDDASPRTARATRDAGDGEAVPADAEAFSAGVSLRRNALERDLRATERRLSAIDGQMTTLARARGQHAPALVPDGLDLRSEEEKDLAAEREKLTQHATQVRNDAAQLRQEVTARLGATPPWWIDLR